MSKHLILILCYGFIYWLYRKDVTWRTAGSKALLIPMAWIAIQGSRPVSYWFGYGGGESNPVNTVAFGIFLIAALVVLRSRRLNWGVLISQNKAIFAIYGYLMVSIFWSEMPFASLKRLIKDFETVLVGLILLTEANPAQAIRTVYVRVSYFLFPLSLIFIKYFPEIGRQSSRAGENMFTGITTQKNTLGQTVFVFGLLLLWDLVLIARDANQKGKAQRLAIRAGMLVMGLWLLVTCDSQTSLLCLILGAVIFWGGSRLVKMQWGKRYLVLILAGIVVLVLSDSAFSFSDVILRALGRDPSLTGRTELWRLVLEQQQNPLLGNGYYVFWDSGQGSAIKEIFLRINTAHNGFLEMYIDGGLVGGALLFIFMLTMGFRVINRLFEGQALGTLGLAFWLLAIFYNFSESSFFRLDVLWFTLVLLALEYRQPTPTPGEAWDSGNSSVQVVRG